MIKDKRVAVIGALMDLGAICKGVDKGPFAVRKTGFIEKLRNGGFDITDKGDVAPHKPRTAGDTRMRYEKEINEANARLYIETMAAHGEGRIPVVVGGDHSVSAGSVSASLDVYKKIGIIWVDAHADFNDDKITPTGNIHGMPLSAVCGCGPDSLVSFSHKRADPKNVVIIGARSVDPLERIKLTENGVTVFSVDDILSLGIEKVVDKAIGTASKNTYGIHLSFDMDALDPEQAPGVGTPVPDGLSVGEAEYICNTVREKSRLVSVDVVETNPLLDRDGLTAELAAKLILCCLGAKES